MFALGLLSYYMSGLDIWNEAAERENAGISAEQLEP